MFKKLAIAALFASAVLADPGLVGGFREVEPEALASIQNDATFAKVVGLARETYRSESNGELGALLSVSQQVVSGTNFKMIFQTENGQEEVIVYSQPWTNTLRVLEMRPVSTRQ